ncbi:TOBE domain-containing protein [Streptomyces sp. NPDC003635]
MRLSIRNQLPGTVTTITPGEVMATVRVVLSGGHHITATITREALDDLVLAPGSAVRVLVKSTEVSVATARVSDVSIRNQIPGNVSAINTGPSMTTVKITVTGGELTAAITTDAATALVLTPGTPVVALIKATEISLATS